MTQSDPTTLKNDINETNGKKKKKKYLLYMAQRHPEFRLAELESLADLYNIDVDLSNYDPESPFCLVSLNSDSEAKMWLQRSILSKAIYEYWGQGATMEELHSNIREATDFEDKLQRCRYTSFKFEFESYRGGKKKRSQAERLQQIESFSYLDLKGKIDLRDPEEVFTVIEEYVPLGPRTAGTTPVRYFFGRLIQESDRGAVDRYDLKKRPYTGTTSFEAELSLVSANIAQVKPGSLMYDPFAGTGSFLTAGGHFKALVIGTDIDGRMIRGRGNANDIMDNFKFYGDNEVFLDVLTMDFTHNAFRSNLSFDTILCDPPYGIRESIKTLGARNPERHAGRENIIIDGQKAYLRKEYIPSKKPYSLDLLLDDLLDFASRRLPIGGRLAFWMPTANDENVETMIPLHSHLELKYNCVQEFHKWSRRLLVYINRGAEYNGPTNGGLKRRETNFRDRYFTKFKE